MSMRTLWLEFYVNHSVANTASESCAHVIVTRFYYTVMLSHDNIRVYEKMWTGMCSNVILKNKLACKTFHDFHFHCLDFGGQLH